MSSKQPHEIIRDLATERAEWSDEKVLAELSDIPPLADESDPAWDDDAYWNDFASRYVALGDVAAERKLRPAVKLLLERACNGDPGEMMRGLRHACEAVFDPDWTALADVCMELSVSERQGTRFWALHQLMILDDPRAATIFEHALSDDNSDIRDIAATGLERLGHIAE